MSLDVGHFFNNCAIVYNDENLKCKYIRSPNPFCLKQNKKLIKKL